GVLHASRVLAVLCCVDDTISAIVVPPPLQCDDRDTLHAALLLAVPSLVRSPSQCEGFADWYAHALRLLNDGASSDAVPQPTAPDSASADALVGADAALRLLDDAAAAF